MKTARHDIRILNVLVAFALVLGLSLTAAAPASANVTAAMVSVTPNSVNSAARYMVNFNVGAAGALTANVDDITITFNSGTTVPTTIHANTVVVNGTAVDNVTTPAPVVVGRAVSVRTPVAVAAGAAVTVVFSQGAGILNPSRATTTARVSVSTSVETTPVNSANYTISPTLTLNPASGPRGTVVTATGAGYGASLAVDIRNTSAANVILASTVSDANGNINTTVTIPNTTPPGTNALQAVDGAGTMSPTSTFTVTPTLTLNPNSGYPGTTVQLIGNTWPANSTVSAATVGGVSVIGTLRGSQRSVSHGFSTGTTHNGDINSSNLADYDTDFISASVAVGDVVINTTDGSAGSVTAVTLNVLTIGAGLSGGMENDFDFGDNYIVLSPQTTALGNISSIAGGQAANVTLKVPENSAPGVKTLSVTIGGATATASFEVVPRLANAIPNIGNVGTLVTLSGSAMTGTAPMNVIAANSITFGGVYATHGAAMIASDGTWTVVNVPVPDQAAIGNVQVVVPDLGGRSATGTFTVLPRAISITPPSGRAGGQITISGSGFKRNGTVNIQQPAGVNRAAATADAAGNFAAAVTTTWLAPAGGNQTIVFNAVDSVWAVISANANLIVPGAAISVSPTTQQLGEWVTVTGTGFARFVPLTSIFIGATNVTPVAGVITDTDGGFSVPVFVPGTVAPGGTTVTVTQGAVVEIATFTVTSGPPPLKHVFQGSAKLDGANAPDSTLVTAIIDGATVTSAATVGGDYLLQVVQPEGQSYTGKTVSFKLAGKPAPEAAVWTAGETTTLNLTASSAGIEFSSGWNFVSAPRKLAQGYSTVSQLFGPVDTAGHTIWLYDNAAWTAMASGDTVKPMDGIWIWSANATRVDLVFDPTQLLTPPTKQLEASWNAVGFSDTVAAPANSALASVEGQWAYLIGFSASQQQYRTSIINNDETGGPHDEDNLMNPAEGYWLYMTGAKELGSISAGDSPMTQSLNPRAAAASETSFPLLPAEFRGTVTLGGAAAPAGARIVARINGVERGSLVTSTAGIFGQSETFGSRLVVMGEEGDVGGTVTFYVNGSPADQTANYAPGQSSALALSATPIMANISGASVILQGSSRPVAGRVVPVTVKVFTPGTSDADLRSGAGALATLDSSTSDGGSNSVTFDVLGITPGTYDITVVSPHTLMNVKKNVTLNIGDNSLALGTLLEGDCNNDNVINAIDFSTLANSYLKSSGQAGFESRADFDRTGTVNSLDFSLLAANYLKTSPRTVA